MQRTNVSGRTMVMIIVAFVCALIAGCGSNKPNYSSATSGDALSSATFVNRSWTGIIAYSQATDNPFPKYTGDGLWLVTPSSTKQISQDTDWFNPVAWSPDGQHLACVKGNLGAKWSLRIFDRAGTLNKTFSEDVDSQVAWVPDSSALLSGVYYSGIYRYPLTGSTKRLMQSDSQTYDHQVAFSPDGTMVYYVHHMYGSRCFLCRATIDQVNGKIAFGFIPFYELSYTDHDEEVQVVPTNDLIYLGYGSKIEAVSKDGKLVRSKDVTSTGMRKLSLSPDGQYLACYNSVAVYIYRSSDLSNVYTIAYDTQVSSYAWSPDSTALAFSDLRLTENSTYAITICWLSDHALQQIYTNTHSNFVGRGMQNDYNSSLAWTK